MLDQFFEIDCEQIDLGGKIEGVEAQVISFADLFMEDLSEVKYCENEKQAEVLSKLRDNVLEEKRKIEFTASDTSQLR